jgi:hypothetical protein
MPQRNGVFTDIGVLARRYGFVRLRDAPGDEDYRLNHYALAADPSASGTFMTVVYIPALRRVYVQISARFSVKNQASINDMVNNFRIALRNRYPSSSIILD